MFKIAGEPFSVMVPYDPLPPAAVREKTMRLEIYFLALAISPSALIMMVVSLFVSCLILADNNFPPSSAHDFNVNFRSLIVLNSYH